MQLQGRTLFYLVAINIVATSFLYQRMVSMGVAPAAPELIEIVKGYVGLSKIQKYAVQPYTQCGLLSHSSYVVKSKRVVLPDTVKPASVLVQDGKIAAIHPFEWDAGTVSVLDYGNKVVSPGVVDVHAHLNEPGKEEWEGISTGTAAAAAGGVTTVVDMPLNSFPCTCTMEALKKKMELAKAKSHVNIGFWGGLIPGNAFWADELDGMLTLGALGLKTFLSPSGINDFPNTSRVHLEAALPMLKYKGVPLYVHAEIVSEVPEPEGDPRKYSTYLATRPRSFEQEALTMLVDTLLNTTPKVWNKGFKVHIAHLGDGDSLPLLKIAQKKLPISVETCPHYLNFAAEDIPDGATVYKCAPPIRSKANQAELIQGVLEGTISMLGSDHSPAPGSMKEVESGNFLKAWGGISGLQHLLPASWSALEPHGLDLPTLASLLSAKPAELAGLGSTKGSIEEGKDADLVVWDPEAAADTSPSAYLHRHKLSPYLDLPLKGAVEATFVRGNLVWSKGEGLTPKPCGIVVKKPYNLKL